MRDAALVHRALWLGRIRRLTGLVAVLATAGTLLIATVVGTASVHKKVGVPVLATIPHQHRVIYRRATPAELHQVAVERERHQLALRRERRRSARGRAEAAPKRLPVTPAPQPTPPPVPAPVQAAPVVVSGGS